MSEGTMVQVRSVTVSARARAALVAVMVVALLPALSATSRAGLGSPPGAAKADPALLRAVEAAPGALVHVIVREAAPASDAGERAVRRLGGSISHELPIIGGFSATIPGRALGTVLASSAVSNVYGDGAIHMAGTSIKALNAKAPNTVWQSVIGLNQLDGSVSGSGVGVALLDTGVASVPDLQGHLVTGIDVTPDHNGVDYYGHGTHMAGIIAGNGASSGGQWVGVAPGATIVSVKVAGWNGSTDVSEVIAGLQWVYFNHAQYNIRVLNLSFGTDSTQSYSIDPLDYAVEKVWKSGVLVVVAAGNRGASGGGTINKPGDDPYVLSVGAADLKNTLSLLDDTVASFSSRGPTADGISKPDMLAPGITIVSDRAPGSTIDQLNPTARVGDAYFKGTGTSQAAAVVSGVAALMYQVNANLSPDQAKSILMNTANSTYLNMNGAGQGLLKSARAVTIAQFFPNRFQPANQGLTPSNGTGSIEASRGSFHVYADLDGDGTPELVQGEVDVLGNTWDGNSWAANSWDANTWDASSWDANSWLGTAWTASSWDANTWDASSWDANTWDSNTWDGNSWS